MTAHRTHALVAALSFTAAATLSACGGSSGDDPTTQSVDEYAKTQAAKRKSTTKTSEPSGTPTSTESDSSTTGASGSKPTSQAPSSSREPLPGEVTDSASVTAARKTVSNYITAFNKAGKKPSTRGSLDRYAAKSCKSCTALKATLAKLAKAKQRLGDDLVTFTPSDVRTAREPHTVRVFGMLDQARTPVLDKDGKAGSHTKDTEPTERAFFVSSASKNGVITEIKAVAG